MGRTSETSPGGTSFSRLKWRPKKAYLASTGVDYRHRLLVSRSSNISVFSFRRFKSIVLGHVTTSHVFGRRRKTESIFVRDSLTFCRRQTVAFLYTVLFKIKEMMFFTLRNDLSEKREERFQRYQNRSATDQLRLDEQLLRTCNSTFDLS